MDQASAKVIMPDGYFYKIRGREFGAVTLHEIQELLKQETLRPGDQVRKGGETWRDAAEFLPSMTTNLQHAGPQSSRTMIDTSVRIGTCMEPAEAQWKYRTDAGIIGPLGTGEFLAAVASGRVKPTTMVRLNECNSWIPASEIEGIPFCIEKPEQAIQTSSTDTVEPSLESPTSNNEMRRLIAECLDQQGARLVKKGAAEKGPPAWNSRGFVASLVEVVSSALSTLSDMCSPLLKAIATPVIALANYRLLWLCNALFILLFVLLFAIPISWTPLRPIQQTLKDMVTELKALQAQNLGQEKWSEFQQRSTEQLAEMIPPLFEASQNGGLALSLLLVARDLLPPLLADPDNVNVEGKDRVDKILAFVDNELQKPFDFATFAENAFVALDIALACVAIAYFGYQLSRKYSVL